ncbi:MAG: hypothetical protein JWN85_4413 [Gammaproteobacteria bacterium]|nr:hypothetical protein [Gammaproteobacteria bacterium]
MPPAVRLWAMRLRAGCSRANDRCSAAHELATSGSRALALRTDVTVTGLLDQQQKSATATGALQSRAMPRRTENGSVRNSPIGPAQQSSPNSTAPGCLYDQLRGGAVDDAFGSLLLDESGGVGLAPPEREPEVLLSAQSDPCPAASPTLSGAHLPELCLAGAVVPASARCIVPFVPLLSLSGDFIIEQPAIEMPNAVMTGNQYRFFMSSPLFETSTWRECSGSCLTVGKPIE